MTTLFDIQTGFGCAPGQAAITADDLRAEMRRLQIDRALACITPENMEFDVPFTNETLFTACADDPMLVPCPIVMPNSGDDYLPEEAQVEEAMRHGAGTVFIRPAADYWILAEWVCDRLFNALEAHRMPVLCLERLVPLEQVAGLAKRYPRLPLIVAESGYRQQRILLPLLETFPNVYLSTGNNYIVYKGIEQLVERGLTERLLFGTGFPASEAMSAVTQLMYAEISEEQRQLIGAGNMDRLMGGIIR
ncbi:MAG: amidohydrolase family protein [Armatimonadota bacterium]